jgi:hypothetical protein
MPSWCENNMKITGAAEEIARLKQTCIRPDEEDGEPTFDFNAVVPMPAVLEDGEDSFSPAFLDAGLLMIGRGDLCEFPTVQTLTEMLDYPWVKEAGIKTVEELKEYLLKDDPEIISKAQRAITRHEQTGCLNAYFWRYKNWGTKWNACGFYLSKDEPTCLECFFNTAWGPPEPVWEKLGRDVSDSDV